MKKIIPILLTIVSFNVSALNLDNTDSYLGKVQSVAVGFFDHVGISLPNGITCNNQKALILTKDNAQFDKIYSLLLAAASQSDVHLYRVAANKQTYGPTSFCKIGEAAYGQFALWPVNS
ncbi:hypothetical protein [Photobacterium sp.]|uniref:hypothetical protein n=1 Tax=Photobacterium sp. TaxID=660 RepID=UPI00299F111C|nr:hypothetical protein [Photobacterium sp.]MDX1304557.1 hypothetical protein [Photobacterium sp.]